jgi:hypothetical protein
VQSGAERSEEDALRALHLGWKLFLLEIGRSGIRRNMRNRMTYPQLLGEQQECECDIGKGSTEFHRGVMENYNVKQYAVLSDPPSPGCEGVRLYQSFNSAYPKMNKGRER